MRRKVYTIIISPSSLSPPIKFTLHRSTIWLLFFTFIILIAYGILGSIKFWEEKKLYAEYLKIKKEKAELEQVNAILAQLRKKENLIRKFLGLDTENPQKPGQGGPGSINLKPENFSPQDKKRALLPEDSFHFPNIPLSPYPRAILLNADLQELIEFLAQQKIELARLPTISPISSLDSWITCGFGVRKSPFTGLPEFHSGLDIFAMRGTPVIAPGDGKVLFVGVNGQLGKTVKIRHNAHYETVYGHLSGYAVKVNQIVKRGEIIGYVGKTGNSTGYHLHYEIHKDKKPIDPFPCLLNWEERHLLSDNHLCED